VVSYAGQRGWSYAKGTMYAHEIVVSEVQRGSKLLFSDVSVKLGGGNRYGRIGANGCGESTFTKILGGELEPSAGSVAIEFN